MALNTVLSVLLIVTLVIVLPSWPYSRAWGYAPSSLLGLTLMVVVLLSLGSPT